ncbi:Ankyrin repeat domain containing protein [Balamuthia mandrillaris]
MKRADKQAEAAPGLPTIYDLPAEMLAAILSMLPCGMAAVAARTCKRWFSCFPQEGEEDKRHFFTASTACASVNMLKWSLRNGYFVDQRSCAKVAAMGNLFTLQWLRCTQDCPWDGQTCEQAAFHGHLHVLQWALEQGCPWSPCAFAMAARQGHLQVLRWVLANQRELDCKRWCPDTNAALGGQWEVLKWLHTEAGCAWSGARTCSAIAAATNGHLVVLKWAWEQGCPSNEWGLTGAAHSGHLSIVKWAYDNGWPMSEELPMVALFSGRRRIVRWLKETPAVWRHVKDKLCDTAAARGQLHILRWAREQGEAIPWSATTCAKAARGGHLAVLKWAHQNGCEWDQQTCIEATKAGHLETLTWAVENGCPCNREACIAAAMQQGHSDIVAWMYQSGFVCC